MKDDNLPPDNETVEDGGGNYVAGSREEYNAYLNYEDVQKELETAKGLIKALIPIAEDRLFSVPVNELTSVEDVIIQCKQFLK